MKFLLALTILMSSNCFSYVYSDDTDEISISIRQQEIENRINAIESKQRFDEQEKSDKDFMDLLKSNR